MLTRHDRLRSRFEPRTTIQGVHSGACAWYGTGRSSRTQMSYHGTVVTVPEQHCYRDESTNFSTAGRVMSGWCLAVKLSGWWHSGMVMVHVNCQTGMRL